MPLANERPTGAAATPMPMRSCHADAPPAALPFADRVTLQPDVRSGSASCDVPSHARVGLRNEVAADAGGIVVTFERVAMDGRNWFSRNRRGGWRTLIDAETGRATAETCFVEDAAFEGMLLSGRAVATPVAAALVAVRHAWFVDVRPVDRGSARPLGSTRSTGPEA